MRLPRFPECAQNESQRGHYGKATLGERRDALPPERQDERVPFSHFDPPTQVLLEKAYADAWQAIGGGIGWSGWRKTAAVIQITRQLVVAAEGGERDHDRLVVAAIHGVDRA
jgi:hypothetical protein